MTKKPDNLALVPAPPKSAYVAPTPITPDILLEMQNRAAVGWSTRQISEWLMKEKGIKYSHISVAKRIKKSRSERKQYSEEILKPYLEKTLTSDLDLLDEIIKDARKVLKDAQKGNEPRLVLSAIDRLDKLLNTRRKFCGIEDKDEDSTETVDINYKEIADRFNFDKPNADFRNQMKAEAVIAELPESKLS